MKDILWISLRAPYEKVSHGGGKTHYFYLKAFLDTNKYNVRLITFCFEQEKKRANLLNDNLLYDVSTIRKNKFVRNLLRKLNLPVSLIEYIYVKKEIRRKVKKYKAENYKPDIIILHWTEIVMLERYIKKIYPDCPIVAIEEDVTFLKLDRKIANASGIKKGLLYFQGMMIKRKELYALANADKVVLNNKKDFRLVIENGISPTKCVSTVPFFEDMSDIERKFEKGNILYWGAMNRPENIEAVKWFVTNVFEKIEGIKLYIVGANPPEEIKSLANDRIIITGFVDDPRVYFENSMCMVAPLISGAGIKIKVLEAMSAGIPVLTNNIGIEGIEAENLESYIHCEKAEEYIYWISKLLSDNLMVEQIGKNSKQNIKKLYNLDNDIQKLVEEIGKIVL